MMDSRTIQGILSIGALFCIVVGWLNLFSPEVNYFIYRQVFYVLIGASFFMMVPSLVNRKMVYPMYLAALFCVVGAFLPEESRFSGIKSIGLFAGVLISIFNRPRISGRS
ncbi:hypothetical protein [Bergeyella sp. RCAD1439]|uniref:hypothetical protein n=1 Tax=Bergeyella anatis TaxID=3113737 RepID=UPI002E1808E4|nr:hypothetical protein [Bergeyella sp. RCAD1439]